MDQHDLMNENNNLILDKKERFILKTIVITEYR